MIASPEHTGTIWASPDPEVDMSRTVGSALLLLLAVCHFALASEFPVLTGPYLGQDPPGSTPRLFAPGIVSVSANFEHSAAVFSPDGLEVFWCTNVNWYASAPAEGLRLYHMRMVDGVWSAPAIAPFTQNVSVPVQRPVYSPDGDRLYVQYSSNPNAESDDDIYVVEREGTGWSELTSVSPLINSSAMERLHSVTADGSMIFTRDLRTSHEAVYISRFVDGTFTEPGQLGEPFDSDANELAIVVAPDWSYMLIGITRTGMEDELYVSYKEEDGTWTERIRTPYQCGGFLALSPDGEYLFFLGDGIFWVDTSFVEELKPARLR